MKRITVLLLCVAASLPAQEPSTSGKDRMPFALLFPLGYDFTRLENQVLHSPAAGAGFLLGEQELSFTEVERRFFGLALYQPLILLSWI